MKRLYHLPSSAQVFVRSWVSVLAVTTPRASGKVEIAHKTNQELSADFPTPWPEAVASCTACSAGSPSRIASRTSTCQASGPAAREGSFAPRKAPRTKRGDQR